MNVREEVGLYALIVRWAIGIALLFGLLTAGYLKVWPTLRGMWFEGVRAGNEYQTTQESMLFMFLEDYQDLEAQIAVSSNPEAITAMQGQQQAIVDRMERAAATLHIVPPEISQFLATH